ncbi:hypothetical protein [Nitrosospira sp. NRS527]|uniref:hypothetical protein n=1 Tax=Nitrosospira sp. NRS527 TaxID=155925 RepID=UPI001AFBC6FC|nr:hypothetical protein [Nitrosospira sp. NRS527]BCT67735.1 hypothetical protein NNRS527_01323 [Nitrosospira sp. NRS527]
MWSFNTINNPTGTQLSFSDGMSLNANRGGNGISSRLIVNGQGFLDITDFCPGHGAAYVDFNGRQLGYNSPFGSFTLTLPGNGTFTVQLDNCSDPQVSGSLKPFPTISAADAAYLTEMFNKKYVPYQNIPDAPGKTTQQIAALGQQYFPFTPWSFQLAMSVYDWTTASFTRMVLMKIFEYTGIGSPPYPLDLPSIATAIWESNWGTYNPQNVDYMHSFMMEPASCQQDVLRQLEANYTELQNFSAMENRLLTAAFQSMPRTGTGAIPQLFSWQVDIYQLGTEHFGIEFLQCPRNAGSTLIPLQIPLADALASYIQVGDSITTKMVWSFSNSMDDAMEYQNGIILVANPPVGAVVWGSASYITPLSDDPTKIEYTFAPETTFLVQSVQTQTVDGKSVLVITLQPN